jgi:phage-related minor tail protein
VTVLRMLTGLSAEEALRTFDGQAESVTQWAIKTNRAYNFLTAAQVSYIRTLQAQGRDQEAVRLANDELAKTLESRSIPAIGALERAWNQVAAALGKVKDNVLAIGRPETVDEQVRTLQQRIASLTPQRDRAVGRARGAFDEQLNAYQAELDLLLRLRNADALRRAERAAAVLEEQREIERQSKQHQDALAGLAEAGARARTAALLAALDREQAAVESADARGLLQAEQKAARLNAIEQRRLRAQAALLERQREIEAGRTTETPTDEVAKQTALTGLEAQLTELRARIAVAESQAVDIVEAAALQRARERAERWGEIWKKVLDGNRELQQRAEEARAQSLANPAERAEEAARLATAELRRQADELQAAARAQVSDSRVRGEGDPLQRELDRNIELNRLEQERVAREARMAALRDAADEQLEALALKESALDLEVQRGALNAEEAERRKFEARRQALPQLEAILQLLREMAATPAEANAVEQAAQRVKALGVIVSEAERFSRDTLSGGLATLFNDIATGAETAEIAVKKFFVNMLKAALNFIAQRLGMRIAESLIATGSASGGWFASLFHAGGVVGHSAAPMRRVAPAALLAGAQVLHAGGVAGLAADEQLAILRKGEEVLTRSDPRHVFNGGAGGPVIGQLSVKVDTGTTGTAAGDQQMADALARGLRGVVQAYVAEQMRPGGLLEARRGGV